MLKKIKITTDHQNESFKELFAICYCIESIKFIKLFRNNITNMSYMFYYCISLKYIKLSYFNSNNVTNICFMLTECC